VVAIFKRTLVTSVAGHGAAGATGYLGLNREARQPETVIVSEEYGRQIRPGRLVVQPRGHQRHWLDDPKAILKAPTKKV